MYNGIGYRGYYLDSETGWYFLNARYYSPEWRRFISPDDTAYLDSETPNGLNLYCYCNNDSVNYYDPFGNSPTEWWGWALAGVITAGLIVGAVFTGSLLGGAFLGAAIGGIAGYWGGAGTQNVKSLNSAKKVSKAMDFVNKVLGKMNTGYYSSARYARAAFTNVSNRLAKAIIQE